MVAPLTATALIAQQVGSNAIRDGLFLSSFPVETLPYVMAGAALLSVPAAQLSGHVLRRFGPARVVPVVLGASALLFFTEWGLFTWLPRAASVLLYLHSSVLGAIAISAFWSLLNERFDPHSAKLLMARVAAAASFGGLIGGIGAALLPQGALLLILGGVAGGCIAGALVLGRGAAPRRVGAEEPLDQSSGWTHLRRQPLLRDLALVITLAAVVAAFVDYLLKAEAVAFFGRGDALVRFFGLFYAGTGLVAMLIQSALGRLALARLGLGGSVASHAIVVGAASVLGFVAPFPWRGVLPRGLDVAVRNSIFRMGYELLYTPLAEATKRSAKSLVDVACDSAGKGVGAVVILLLVGLAPEYPFMAVNLAAVFASSAELAVARRLRSGYVGALEGGLRRQGGDLEPTPQYSMADFTIAGSMGGIDRAALLRALESSESPATAIDAPAPPADPVVACIADLRSGDLTRIRGALRHPPSDPVLVGALVPLLARSEVVRPVVAALESFGARAAGEMVSALNDPATPDVVKRRLPLALKGCPSPLARDGLVAGLDAPSFELRFRCARALLALTDDHPELLTTFPSALAAVGREVGGDAAPHLVREHVFNLLALAIDREPVRIAARSFTTDDEYVRGTALEYLETVLTPQLFAALLPLLAAAGAPRVHRRAAADVRADLIRAGATIAVSRDELRRQLEAAARDES